MKVIVCVDNKNGMMFNRRRQSRDSEVVKDILEMVGDENIWIDEYSRLLLEGDNVVVDSDFLNNANQCDYVFVENRELQKYTQKITEIIIYCWNRDYPGDFYFDIDLSKGWELYEETEFEGTSHEKLTKKKYIKKC